MEEGGFATVIRVRWVQEVAGDFVLVHYRQMGVG
jgi:hypothetical protein